MAPALVELSTSKERNSNSKKYIENFCCMSHLNLELVEKIGFDSSPLYPQSKEIDVKIQKENHRVEVMLSNQVNETQINVQSNEFCNEGVKEGGNIPTPFCNGINSVLIGHQEMPSTQLNQVINFNHLNTTNVERTKQPVARSKQPVARSKQPVARYSPSSEVVNILSFKETSVNSKFSSINNRLNSISQRLINLHNKDLSSHVSCYITKSEGILQSHLKFKDSLDVSKLKTTNEPLESTYDLLNSCCLTDDEDILDLKQRVPLRGKRQKNIRPAPTPTVLNQWKQNRAKLGSQCSWLTLKMAALDEKISSLNKIHSRLKTNRTVRNHAFEESSKQISTLPSQSKNGLISKDIETTSVESSMNWDCSRTRPVENTQLHKYISNEQTRSPLGSNLYHCRCVSDIQLCRICNKRFNIDQQHSVSLVEFCDPNFHPVLSQKSDISLAFLLEDTLRHERINTKVTITKSKKKKKRPTSLSRNASPIDKKCNEKQPNKLSKKSERSKSDEYSRKRYAASDISGKLKKFRKLSESCDSGSKPSTPTNELASPLSQSLPSGGLSGLRRKKGSSSVDYDINNIVIPYSIASSTRVERIQYKEIPTPGWRTANDMLLNNGAELDRELTDDETFSERHARCELVEHKRFTDYFQPVRRQRSTRISEGPNSEPLSPYMQDEQSLINTPIESPNFNMSLTAKLQNRLANVCACDEEERESPWDVRVFPLSETDGSKLEDSSAPPSPMNQEMKKYSKQSSIPRSPSFTILHNTPRNSPLPSPSPLTNSPTPDSNWTVKVINEDNLKEENVTPVVSGACEKQRKGIVLKLAKK